MTQKSQCSHSNKSTRTASKNSLEILYARELGLSHNHSVLAQFSYHTQEVDSKGGSQGSTLTSPGDNDICLHLHYCGKEVVHLYRTVPAKGGWVPGISEVGSTRVPSIPKLTNLARGR